MVGTICFNGNDSIWTWRRSIDSWISLRPKRFKLPSICITYLRWYILLFNIFHLVPLALDSSDYFLRSCKAKIKIIGLFFMKLQPINLAVSLMLVTGNLSGQTNQAGRLFIPYLDKESQSNVVVTACNFAPPGLPCPAKYTNVLSNPNLFSSHERQQIEDIFKKYKNITTNSGPPGTIFSGLYKTNVVIPYLKRTNEVFVSYFRYTNLDAQEEWTFGRAVSVKFRTKLDKGYNVSFTQTGNGTFFQIANVKDGVINKFLASFEDSYWQGANWDFRRADFTHSHLLEYRQYTNGMVFGKFLMWDPRERKLAFGC